MTWRKGWVSSLFGLGLMGLSTGGCMQRATGTSNHPTTVYVAKRIRTLDAQRPLATALAVRDGKILAVGSREEVLARAGASAKVDELGEATIVPGLEDAHGHLLSLGKSLLTVDLQGARTLSEVLHRLERAAASSYQGDWLVGRGWDQNSWPETAGEFPTRAALDVRFPRTPVALSRVDGHALWVNGEALRRMHVDARTLDPEGGRFVRDARGEPTGILVDNAMRRLDDVLPDLTDAQRAVAMHAALERCAAVGLTEVHDAGMDLKTFQMLQGWDAKGALPLRIYVMAYGQGQDAEAFLERGVFKGHHLELRAVKFLLDGALGSRGAALEVPYSDDAHERGLLLMTEKELEARVRKFMARGFQVAIHAIGDRANRLVLDVFERVQPEQAGNPRNRLEHAQILRPEDLPRFAQLGVIASMQPTHATSDMAWAEHRLGKTRLKTAYAWKSLLRSGAHLALGSDFPVERPDPIAGIYAARTRQDARGQPAGGWFPEERLTGEEALEGFTTGAAYAAFAEEERGRLMPGMDADFTILSVDPVDAPVEDLLHAKVLGTVVDGHRDT